MKAEPLWRSDWRNAVKIEALWRPEMWLELGTGVWGLVSGTRDRISELWLATGLRLVAGRLAG